MTIVRMKCSNFEFEILAFAADQYRLNKGGLTRFRNSATFRSIVILRTEITKN